MRVCPECGHADPFWWRPRSSRPYCEYTKVDTLEWNNPELLAKIREVHPDYYDDEHFIYHITRSGLNVERIELELFETMRWGSEPTEHVDHKIAHNHQLTEFLEDEER